MIANQPTTSFYGLFRRRQCLVPTWRAWFLVLVIAGLPTLLAFRNLHSFLALSVPIPGGILVVEGWAPDYVMAEAIAEFKRGQYTRLVVTGGPLDKGVVLEEYNTHAELGAAVLIRMGLHSNLVEAVPAPLTRQDRTYASATALRKRLMERGDRQKNINLVSLDAHSRRSRLLFAKALGDGFQVGILAVPDQEYDGKRWWDSSRGIRQVIGESLAYLYARLWFTPPTS
jgi:hypothetical protein